MKILHIVCFTALIIILGLGPISASEEKSAQEFRQGRNFIQTTVYSEKEDLEILKLFEGLRVADVSDGMDKSGLHGIGLVDPKISPLWKDTEHFTHRIAGIAVTARYVPTQRPPAGQMEPKDFDEWEGHFYTHYSSEPFADIIRKGTVLVFDDADDADVGSIGSYNIMDWASRGCVGVITDASARDTDEIIAVKIPLYMRQVGRGIRPGRNEIESVNRPVEIGGALVKPGDVIVADGDGVIVVPREHAKKVAVFAHEIMERDKEGRRELYKRLGLPLDASIKK
ncbi:MAG: RraA family protein [Candidatus Aminicenantes bacterium]|jgi:regulator of RNase E activity RraA